MNDAKAASEPLSSRGGTGRENVSVAAGAAPIDPWQPIATAPKDGAEILVAHFAEGEWVMRVAYWTGSRWWLEVYDDGEERSYPFDCTHWMPLPRAPGTTASGEKAGITQAERAQRTSEHPALSSTGDERREKVADKLRRWLPPAGTTLEREDYDLFIEAADLLRADGGKP